MNDNKAKLLGVIALFVALAAGLISIASFLAKRPAVTEGLVGGLIHNTQESFDAGLAVSGTEVISSARAVKPASLVIGGGTAISKHLNTTATINVDSINAGSSTSSRVTLSGAAANGSVVVTPTGDWSSASSSVYMIAVPTTNAVTVYFKNTSSTAAVNLTNSTYVIDYWAH